MCSHQDWESLRRRFQQAIDEGEVREFVADDMPFLVDSVTMELNRQAYARLT